MTAPCARCDREAIRVPAARYSEEGGVAYHSLTLCQVCHDALAATGSTFKPWMEIICLTPETAQRMARRQNRRRRSD